MSPRPKERAIRFNNGIKRKKKPLALTPDDIILRQLSLRYFVDKSLTVKEVAKKLNTTPNKLKGFFKDEEYTEELSSRIEKIHGVGTDFMQSQAKISLLHLYEEIRRREVEGELVDLPMRELHRILMDTLKELRLDTPGAFTSKVGVADLTDLQDRYKKSLSGRMNRLEKKKRRLKNVTPDNKLLDEGNKSNNGFEADNKVEARRVGESSSG